MAKQRPSYPEKLIAVVRAARICGIHSKVVAKELGIDLAPVQRFSAGWGPDAEACQEFIEDFKALFRKHAPKAEPSRPMMVLAWAKERGEPFANRHVAQAFGWTSRQARSVINNLYDCGFIRVESQTLSGKRNYYEVIRAQSDAIRSGTNGAVSRTVPQPADTARSDSDSSPRPRSPSPDWWPDV